MENEIKKEKNNLYALPVAVVIAGIIIAGSLYISGNRSSESQITENEITKKDIKQVSALEESVLPSKGVVLPVSWGSLGSKLAMVGAIDAERFKAMYESRGTFNEEYKNLLSGQNTGSLKITKENSGYLLNLF